MLSVFLRKNKEASMQKLSEQCRRVVEEVLGKYAERESQISGFVGYCEDFGFYT